MVSRIEAYGKEVDTAECGLTCQLTVNGQDFDSLVLPEKNTLCLLAYLP